MGTQSSLIAGFLLFASTQLTDLSAQVIPATPGKRGDVVGNSKRSTDTSGSNIDTMSTLTIKKERGAFYSGKGVGLTEVLTENEFKKAACCTLSESFELSNTVEVSNADGVSGIKQVEMLGLAGKYVLMSRENIPSINGLATLNGLSNIPGPMVSSVHLAKGAGSATLGADGLTGGLNYQMKADLKDPRLYFNAYSNHQGRAEANAIVKTIAANKSLSHTYLHSGGQYRTTDMGNDGLADMPLTQRYFVSNHTQIPGKKMESQFGILGYQDRKYGGTLNPGSLSEISDDSNAMRFNFDEQHIEGYAKLGIFLSESGDRSLGNIFNVSRHRLGSLLNSLQGRNYQGVEDRIYYSSIYQMPEKNDHNLKLGVSALGSHLQESLSNDNGDTFNLDGWQKTAGIFGEYTIEGEAISAVFGLRGDWHSVYGLYATPRIHLKWALNKQHRINAQGGLARRSSYFLSEHLPQLINGRTLYIDQSQLINQRWMPQEKAWNYGLSYLGNFMVNDYPATLAMDVFETRFQSQVLVDRDLSDHQLLVHSVSGEQAGRTRTAQIDFSAYFHRRWSYKLSYRWIDSRVWLDSQFMQQPLQSVHRALAVMQYNTRNKWYFDFVAQYNSKKRLPYYSTVNHPKHPGYSPDYVVINFQIRKVMSPAFEWYIGGENLGNVQNHHPVMNWEVPASNQFDAGYAWGPTNGYTVYAGLRYNLF